MKLPDKIKKYMDDGNLSENKIGLSSASVFMLTDKVLKVQNDLRDSYHEYQIINWLKQRIPTPKIIAYEVDNHTSYMLMSKIEGKMLCDEEYLNHPLRLVELLMKALNMLWSVDEKDCPIDNSLDEKLKRARYNVENNLVDLEHVEEDTFSDRGFKDPFDLLNWLENNRPEEEIVFSHGDLSLPNIIVEGEEIKGFIDLGNMGKADKWQDIAICYRSLKHNLEGRYNGGIPYQGYDTRDFFKKLKIDVDEKKLKYYLLLDELF